MAIGFELAGVIESFDGFSLQNPTSLEFGPDGRLYVSQQNGAIIAYELQIVGGEYLVTSREELLTAEGLGVVSSIMNHNDFGDNQPGISGRQVTGLVTTVEGGQIVLYVTSSDPRIATNADSNLDTNSSTITRISQNNDGSWTAVDILRGLPRSEENHSANGMVLSEDGTKLYVSVGGNTNNGAP